MAAEEEKAEEQQQGFEGLGLDPRLVRALAKKDVADPTPIQRVGIPLILEGKDVVARANTGSGKTFTYLLPMLQKLFSAAGSSGLRALVLVPSKELCKQVHDVAASLLEYCRVPLKVAQLLSDMPLSDLKMVLAGQPEVLVSTPSCVATCLSRGTLQGKSLQDSLSMLVLDEADLLLSFGYEDDIKALVRHVPRSCQCLLMTATPSDGSGSADVERLKKLVLHNPVILTLSEDKDAHKEIIPRRIEQFWISCSLRDKLLHILALLKLEIIRKKVLIFVNSIDMGFRLRLFLEQFGIRSVVLNAELPQNSRLHILEEFNAGLYDYLIATDISHMNVKDEAADDQAKSRKTKHARPKLDSEFGVVRGIDFQNVFTVVNFDMPLNSAGYVHRIGRTGRAQKAGAAISLVCPEEEDVFGDIKSLLGELEHNSANLIVPFPLLTKDALEALRYRAEDIAKGVTKAAIREARAQDLRNEILNSQKLKAHFEVNPMDLDLLKHDKVLSKKPPPSHLREVPEYLVDPKTREASMIVKLSQVAMNVNSSKKRVMLKRGRGKSRDPLRTFSTERKKSRKLSSESKTDGSNTKGSRDSKKRKREKNHHEN